MDARLLLDYESSPALIPVYKRVVDTTFVRLPLADSTLVFLGIPRPDSSVVERGPEKAGVGGSIPSLATTFSTLCCK